MRNPEDLLRLLKTYGHDVVIVERYYEDYSTYVALGSSESKEPGDVVVFTCPDHDEDIMGINFAIDSYTKEHLGGRLGTMYNPYGLWKER